MHLRTWGNSSHTQCSYLPPLPTENKRKRRKDRRAKNSFRGDGYAFYLFLSLWHHGYIHSCKLIQIYILNICNLLYIKCILIKLGRSSLTQSYEACNSADTKFPYISQLYVWFLFTFQWTILQPKGKKKCITISYLQDLYNIIS